MSFTISASATSLSAKARVANVARVAKRSVAQPMRPRGKSLVVRASVWSGMSTYMKKQCEAAAALEAKDADAGRQAWIDIDKQVPGARMAWMENATAGGIPRAYASSGDAQFRYPMAKHHGDGAQS